MPARVSTGLLLACALLAGCGGPEPDADSKALAEWIISKGGTFKIAGSNVQIKEVGGIPEQPVAISEIVLNETKIRDADLAKLKDLKNLTSLSLYKTNIGDAGLQHLAGLGTLTELELSYTKVTDKGLDQLAVLSGLEKVWLQGTRVSTNAAQAYGKAHGVVVVK